MPEAPIRERLDWEPTPEVHRRIRRLWVRHSIAEDRRSLDGLIATLAPDCVYEVMPTGQRWEGHAGARRFYTELLGAFPDVHFDLRDIVIGPQGVIEVATLTGTHEGPWAGIAPTGRRVTLTVIIHFPWDRATRLFAGERVYFDRAALDPELR
jgi:predicted ester cyclase